MLTIHIKMSEYKSAHMKHAPRSRNYFSSHGHSTMKSISHLLPFLHIPLSASSSPAPSTFLLSLPLSHFSNFCPCLRFVSSSIPLRIFFPSRVAVAPALSPLQLFPRYWHCPRGRISDLFSLFLFLGGGEEEKGDVLTSLFIMLSLLCCCFLLLLLSVFGFFFSFFAFFLPFLLCFCDSKG